MFFINETGKLRVAPHSLGVVFGDMLLLRSCDGVVMLHRRHRATQDVDVGFDARTLRRKFEERFNLSKWNKS
jgi:hypothetical protein